MSMKPWNVELPSPFPANTMLWTPSSDEVSYWNWKWNQQEKHTSDTQASCYYQVIYVKLYMRNEKGKHNLQLQFSQSVSWCFEPRKPQGITSELKTHFSLSPSYSIYKSLNQKSLFFFSQTTTQILSTILECKPRKTRTHVLEPIYIPWAFNTET